MTIPIIQKKIKKKHQRKEVLNNILSIYILMELTIIQI